MSANGLSSNNSTDSDAPWRNKKWLHHLRFNEWYTAREIADLFDCSRSVVKKWLDRYFGDYYSKEGRAHCPTLASRKQLQRLYVEKGLSFESIGEMLGCSKGVVERALHEHGIDTRDPDEFPNGHPLKERKQVPCTGCGETIERTPLRLERYDRHFCCRSCEHEYYKDELYIQLECEHCGEVFKRLESQSNTKNWDFCSGECRHTYYREELPDREIPFGDNWDEQRAKALERDGERCQGCGVSPEDLHYGYLLVHHIKPRKEFYSDGEFNEQEANKLSNLVTLCLSCHGPWEGVPLRPQLAD